MPSLVRPGFLMLICKNAPTITCSLAQSVSKAYDENQDCFHLKQQDCWATPFLNRSAFHTRHVAVGIVHEGESRTSKPPALSENLPSFPSSPLSLLIVLHWLSACENSVGVQLNSRGSNLGPNWKIQVAFTFGLSIHPNTLFPNASPRRCHSVPALLD